MRTSQPKNSICGCSSNNGPVNGTFGRCLICFGFMTNVHGGRTLCGCTTSRGGPQRFDRCKTCNPAGSSVSLVHKTSVNKRTAGAAETVYSALPEVFFLFLSLTLANSVPVCACANAIVADDGKRVLEKLSCSLSLSLSLFLSLALYRSLSLSLSISLSVSRSLALSLSRSLLLLSSLSRSPRSLSCSPFSHSRALRPVSLSFSLSHTRRIMRQTMNAQKIRPA